MSWEKEKSFKSFKLKVKAKNTCQKTSKIIYRTHSEAKFIISIIKKNQNKELYYYKCGSHYHITSQNKYNGKENHD